MSGISTRVAAPPWRRWRHRLEAAAFALPVRLTPLLPYRVARQLGRAIGWLGYRALRQPRRIARANLDAAFGATKTPREKERLARASFQSFGATMLGLFWSVRLTPGTVGRIVGVSDASRRLIAERRARGQGVILIMMHYGNWELLGVTLGLLGIPATIVAKQMSNPAFERVFSRLRGRSGHRIVTGPHALRRVVETLREGGCVALLIDQHVSEHEGGEWCEFFGLPVLTCSTVGRLELRTGAALLACVARPLPAGRTQLDCREVHYTPSGDAAADIHAISQQCLTVCETIIRQQPEHWLWSYKRWRVRPQLEQGRYPAYSRPSRELRRAGGSAPAPSRPRAAATGVNPPSLQPAERTMVS